MIELQLNRRQQNLRLLWRILHLWYWRCRQIGEFKSEFIDIQKWEITENGANWFSYPHLD